jgi:predicted ATPase/DNA-binding SARP family transcriptional activator
MGPVLHIQLLGSFQASYGTDLVGTLSSPRLQSFLAYLLLHRDAPQSRQQVAYTFWPDSTDAQARTNLRKALYDLRQALPDADTYVEADTQTMRWRTESHLTLDVDEFERALQDAEAAEEQGDLQATCDALERAVALYSGDLLPSCYDDWIRPERERLRASYLDALERLAQRLEERRDVRGAVDQAQRLLRHDPLHEPAYRRLMRLHALQGDRAGALHVYHTCVTVLERELGVAPGEETRQAYGRLLEVEVGPSSATGAVDRVSPAPEAPASAAGLPGLVASAPLIGRHPEWAQLITSWERAAHGTAGATLIEGEAGIGKSRLAEELARRLARQGIRVATARCYAAEGALPYAPVVSWLRALPLPELEPVWMNELARLLPERLDRQAGLSPSGPIREPWQRQRLFEALARAALGAARPLLLLLDDLQWCDPDTREWLHYLLRYDPQAPLLVLGTVRAEELDAQHPLHPWTQSLHHDGQVTEIELARLDEADTLALAEHVAEQDLPPELAACIYRETEGNPLFVIEMVRAGLAVGELETACELRELPPRVQGAIEARLGQLSSQARALAETAAVAGRSFSLALLLASTAMEEDEAIVALDELWQRRVVAEEGRDAYDFTHDKLREVAYATLSPVRRRLLHGRVARALEELHAGDIDHVAEEIAIHYDRAGQPTRAIPCYLRAGETARRVYANEEAIAHYQRALELLPRVAQGEQMRWRLQALAALGQVCLWVGDLERAEPLLQEAIALGQETGLDPRGLGMLYYALASAHEIRYRYAEQAEAGEAALALLGEDDASVEKARVNAITALAHYELEGRRDRWRALALQTASFLERLPYVEGMGQVYQLIFDVQLRSRNPREAMRWLRLLERRAAAAGDLEAQATAAHRMGRALANEGNLGAAVPHYRRAVELTLQTGNASMLSYRLFWLATSLLALGNLAEAEQQAQASVHATSEVGVDARVAWQHWLLGLVLLCRAESEEAMDALERSVALTHMDRQPETALLSHHALGRAFLQAGQPGRALCHLASAAGLATPQRLATWHGPEVQPYGLAFVHLLNGLEEAYAEAEAFRAFCSAFPAREVYSAGSAHSPELAQLALGQWFLEQADPQDLGGLGRAARSVAPDLTWVDPLGDCSYTLDKGLEIHAPLGRDLWGVNWSAPRLLRPVPPSAGWALQAACRAADHALPAMGGLLLWVDRDHYLRLDRGWGGPREITLLGCLDGQDVVLGRGRLAPKTGEEEPTEAPLDQVYLRLECVAGEIRALCSADGARWYTAGCATFAMSEEAQCGVYAIGQVDRTVYCGAHAEGTAIHFDAVKLWAIEEP